MKDKEKKSALNEVKGVKEPSRLNKNLAGKYAKRKLPEPDLLVEKILSGDTIHLSKAITLIESNNPQHFALGQEVIKKCLPYTEKSVRIGVTGVPGVGKSTFIEALGLYYTSQGDKVAVLAIDPSSSLSKGSILGDKTRMEQLSRNPNAYIRPSASGNQLGGVARKTRETIMLCEAAGFNKIIVETVGVGQSETMVHSMVDFFLLLKLAGAGDELQGIKRGIIEMADLIVINKAEDDNLHQAKLAQKAFETALHFYPPKESNWQPKVMLASALHNKGVKEIADEINYYIQLTKSNGYFDKKRKQQNEFWLKETILQELKNRFYRDKKIKELYPELVQKIICNELTAFEAADILLNL
jgi:LAO/AO transport system kinase